MLPFTNFNRIHLVPPLTTSATEVHEANLLAGDDTERTRLAMVRKKPLPFPPEPFAWIGIQLTRWALARQDRTGRRNLWLQLGIRFAGSNMSPQTGGASLPESGNSEGNAKLHAAFPQVNGVP